MTVDQLPLQGRDEALGHRVVIGISHRPHRRQEPGFLRAGPELNGGVLAASVGVVDQSRRWPASVESHVQGVQNQISLRVVRHGPADPGRRTDFDATLYAERNVVERCVNALKQWRGIATRYEKRAVNYRAMVVIAALVVWLSA